MARFRLPRPGTVAATLPAAGPPRGAAPMPEAARAEAPAGTDGAAASPEGPDRAPASARREASPPPPPPTPAGPQALGAVEGFLGPRRLLGWAHDPAAPPGTILEVVAVLNGQPIARVRTGTAPEGIFPPEEHHRGFVLDLPPGGPVPGDLSSGRLALVAAGASRPFLVRPRAQAQEQAAAGVSLLSQAEAALGRPGLAETLAVFGRPEGFGAAQLAREANAPLLARVLGARRGEAELSPLFFPLGMRSPDGSAVLGRDGHLFLLAGSNGEVARLGAEPAERDRLVAGWIGLMEARRARCEALGIRFLQLVVPEKAAVVPELLPDPDSGGPTPFLAALEAAVAARPALAACYVSGLEAMRAAGGTAMVRRLDTHPSAAGMHVLARAVLQRLGEDPPDLSDRFVRPRMVLGDLGARFLPEPFLEPLPLVPERAWAGFGAEPEVLARHVPAHGGHLGRHESCRTENAPSPRTVLVFGNSASDFTDKQQGGLSGWLARWFRGYRFHWAGEVDWALAEQSPRPDILLCQTVERFMGRVPAA